MVLNITCDLTQTDPQPLVIDHAFETLLNPDDFNDYLPSAQSTNLQKALKTWAKPVFGDRPQNEYYFDDDPFIENEDAQPDVNVVALINQIQIQFNQLINQNPVALKTFLKNINEFTNLNLDNDLNNLRQLDLQQPYHLTFKFYAEPITLKHPIVILKALRAVYLKYDHLSKQQYSACFRHNLSQLRQYLEDSMAKESDIYILTQAALIRLQDLTKEYQNDHDRDQLFSDYPHVIDLFNHELKLEENYDQQKFQLIQILAAAYNMLSVDQFFNLDDVLTTLEKALAMYWDYNL